MVEGDQAVAAEAQPRAAIPAGEVVRHGGIRRAQAEAVAAVSNAGAVLHQQRGAGAHDHAVGTVGVALAVGNRDADRGIQARAGQAQAGRAPREV